MPATDTTPKFTESLTFRKHWLEKHGYAIRQEGNGQITVYDPSDADGYKATFDYTDEAINEAYEHLNVEEEEDGWQVVDFGVDGTSIAFEGTNFQCYAFTAANDQKLPNGEDRYGCQETPEDDDDEEAVALSVPAGAVAFKDRYLIQPGGDTFPLGKLALTLLAQGKVKVASETAGEVAYLPTGTLTAQQVIQAAADLHDENQPAGI